MRWRDVFDGVCWAALMFAFYVVLSMLAVD